MTIARALALVGMCVLAVDAHAAAAATPDSETTPDPPPAAEPVAAEPVAAEPAAEPVAEPAPAEAAPAEAAPAELAPTEVGPAEPAPPPAEEAPAPAVAAKKVKSAADVSEDKIQMAIMDLSNDGGLEDGFVASLSRIVPEAIESLGPFKAIGMSEIREMLGFERQKSLLGCESDTSCLVEIGGSLGAKFLVIGGVSKIGDTFLVQLQLVNVARSRVDNRVAREYKGGPAGLLDEVRSASKQLVSELLADRAGTVKIHVSEEGATVKIDGVTVGVSPIAEILEVGGGSHLLEVELEGFVRHKQDLVVQAKQQTTVGVTMRPSKEFAKAYRESAETTRLLAWITTGIGVAGIGAAVGIFAGISGTANDLTDEINAYNAGPPNPSDFARLDDERSSIAALDATTLAVGLVGIAALTTGIVLFVIGDDPGRYDAALDTSVAGLEVGFDGRSLVVGGTF